LTTGVLLALFKRECQLDYLLFGGKAAKALILRATFIFGIPRHTRSIDQNGDFEKRLTTSPPDFAGRRP
jgi:hypothetical protein